MTVWIKTLDYNGVGQSFDIRSAFSEVDSICRPSWNKDIHIGDIVYLYCPNVLSMGNVKRTQRILFQCEVTQTNLILPSTNDEAFYTNYREHKNQEGPFVALKCVKKYDPGLHLRDLKEAGIEFNDLRDVYVVEDDALISLLDQAK